MRRKEVRKSVNTTQTQEIDMYTCNWKESTLVNLLAISKQHIWNSCFAVPCTTNGMYVCEQPPPYYPTYFTSNVYTRTVCLYVSTFMSWPLQPASMFSLCAGRGGAPWGRRAWERGWLEWRTAGRWNWRWQCRGCPEREGQDDRTWDPQQCSR